MYIKATHEFTFELNKLYTNKNYDKSVSNLYFYDSLNDTLAYFPHTSRYFEIIPQTAVIDKHNVCWAEKLIFTREILFDELIDLDVTGEWCFLMACSATDISIINRLQQAVIEKDINGRLCAMFACHVNGADINILVKEVLKKDTFGEYCYYIARKIFTPELQQSVIDKDNYGRWCYYFARDINGADVKALEKAIIEKAKDSEWCYKFSSINGSNVDTLLHVAKNKQIIELIPCISLSS